MTKQRYIASYPTLMDEWDYSKNTDIDPTKTAYGSSKKVHWRCKLGHEWEMSLNNRTQGYGCPYCSGRRVSDLNRLSTKFPEVAKEWDSDLNSGLKPQEVSFGSKKKVWWRCPRNHTYQATIQSRTTMKSGCPKCPRSPKIAVKLEDSLQEKFPDISNQFDLEKNAPTTPVEVSHSSNKNFWWKCARGHTWAASPNNRTRHGSGCPNCSSATSRPEMRLFAELSTLFTASQRYRLGKIELDIFLHELAVGIEYDGWYWHRKKESKDRIKNDRLEKKGIRVIRVREKPLKKIAAHDLLIEPGKVTKETVNKLLANFTVQADTDLKERIGKYVRKKRFVNNRKFRELLSFYPAPPLEKSLASRAAVLADEWHPIKNAPLTPELVAYGSDTDYWWQCARGHEWTKSPKHRVRSPKCPVCAREDTRLDLVMPAIAARWHPSKNGDLLPSDVSCGSGKRVWWQCSEDFECEGTIASRCAGHNCAACPLSDRISRRSKWRITDIPELMRFWDFNKNLDLDPKAVTYGSKTVAWWSCERGHFWEQSVRSMNNLRACPECSEVRGSSPRLLLHTHPEVASEFHPTKNDTSALQSLSFGSKQRFWWLCQKGHEWEAPTNSRSSGQGCPFCSGRRLSDKNRLSVVRPDVSKLWHPHKNKNILPSDVFFSSNSAYWWICSKGHEWKCTINVMTSRKRKTLCQSCKKEANLLSICFPELAEEWDQRRNGSLKPSDVSRGSGRKVWWRCANKHSWEAAIANRTVRKSGCPECHKTTSRRHRT